MLGSLLCDAIAAKREDIFKAAIDGRSRAAWASLASPTCHRNGPGSAKCSVFPRTDPVSNPASTNTVISQLGSTEYFAQEYPLIPSEAFISSSFDSFIPAELVIRARKEKAEAYGPLIVASILRAWVRIERQLHGAAAAASLVRWHQLCLPPPPSLGAKTCQ
jgi:hypothetical protein